MAMAVERFIERLFCQFHLTLALLDGRKIGSFWLGHITVISIPASSEGQSENYISDEKTENERKG